MKTTSANALLFASIVAGCAVLTVEAQGTFQNLGFKSALPIPIPGDPYASVQFDAAFPGWVGLVGSIQQSRALYNFTYLDSSGIGIVDSSWSGGGLPPLPPGTISGQYTAVLQAGVTGVNNTPADTTLSQTGVVPLTAQSLRFRAYGTQSYGPLVVSLGGQTLNLNPLSSGVNFTLYGVDVRAWQGVLAQLDFTLRALRPHVDNNNITLDSIAFSDLPIPEPSTISVFGLGTLILGLRLRKRRSAM